VMGLTWGLFLTFLSAKGNLAEAIGTAGYRFQGVPGEV
jgi:hypothetical protein